MYNGLGSLSKTTIAVLSFVFGVVTFMCIYHMTSPISRLDMIPIDDCEQMSKSVGNGNAFINCRNRQQTLITAIYSRDATTWKRNDQICNKCFDFPQTNLKTPKGPTPIFIYNVKNDIWISTRLVNSGGFESENFVALFQMLKDDPELNVIDIGANIGAFALSVAKMGRLVMGVEALNINLQHLCASVMEGGLQDKVVLVYNAISNERTVVNLAVEKNNMGGTFLDADTAHNEHIKDLKGPRSKGQGTYGQIQTITMNDLLELHEMRYFSKVIIKMDIEGFEARALEKSREFFKKIMVVGLYMEWVFHANQTSGDQIIKFMTELNYAPYSKTKVPLKVKYSGRWGSDVLWLPNPTI